MLHTLHDIESKYFVKCCFDLEYFFINNYAYKILKNIVAIKDQFDFSIIVYMHKIMTCMRSVGNWL